MSTPVNKRLRIPACCILLLEVSKGRQCPTHIYVADVEDYRLVIVFPRRSTKQHSKHVSSLTNNAPGNHPFVLPHSDLTSRSPDTRPPYRRIHFPILPSQQGR